MTPMLTAPVREDVLTHYGSAEGVDLSPGLNTGSSQELYQIRCLSPTLRDSNVVGLGWGLRPAGLP